MDSLYTTPLTTLSEDVLIRYGRGKFELCFESDRGSVLRLSLSQKAYTLLKRTINNSTSTPYTQFTRMSVSGVVPEFVAMDYKSIADYPATGFTHSHYARGYLPLKDEKEIEVSNFVYVMMNKSNGLFKIGRSKDPATREKCLQTAEPQIELISSWPADKSDEKELHKLFDDKRVVKEWFRLSIDDLKGIDEYFEEKKRQ